MAIVTFLRHAETEFNQKNIFCGTTDCSITPNGEQEAIKLRRKFPKKFDKYFCSPLKRTWQTLYAIYPNANFSIDNRITEIDLGEWEGLSKSSVDQTLRNNFKNGIYSPNGSESQESVKKRLNNFINYLKNNYNQDEKILVVTHNGFLRTLAHQIGIDPIKKNLEYFTIDTNKIKTEE